MHRLVRLYRGDHPDFALGGDQAKAKLTEVFGRKPKYTDIRTIVQHAWNFANKSNVD